MLEEKDNGDFILDYDNSCIKSFLPDISYFFYQVYTPKAFISEEI